VACSPDGKQVASGSRDRTVKIWQACACVSEERGDGEGVVPEELSLLSDTLRRINLAKVVIGPFGLRGPMHLCQTLSGHSDW
jgi:WD40 repeat protein